MRDEVLCAFEHRHYPCVAVIEQLQHQKDHSRPKLFSVMAGVQNDKSAFVQIQLGQAKLYTKDVYRVEAHGARFDLAIGLDPLGSDIKFFCTYNTDLFKPKTIQRMMDGIVHLIGQVVKQSNLKLGDYPLELDKATINCLQAINDTEKCFPNQSSIHTLFEEQVVKTPDALAILEGKDSLSYKALNALSNQYANYLKARGLQPSQGVALVLEPGSRVVALLLAVLKVGAFYVPLSRSWPKARILKAMQSLDLALLIEEEALDAITDLSVYSANNLELQVDKHHLAYVVQTSGTTNEPKNIPITHEGVVNLLHATQANYQLSQDDKVLWLTSYTFDASLLELFWPLSFGASIVLLEENKDPLSIATSLHTHQVTVVQMVPVLLKALCEVVALDNQPKEVYKLRLVISGGALLTRAIRDLCIATLPGKLVNHYGPSEVTVDATSFDCELDFEGDSVPIGKPIANAKVLVVDSHLQPVPIGFTGEILVASPGLMPGYLPNTNDSPSVFVELVLPGHTQLLRFYKTKDLGKLHESGVIYYQGRKDKQVKVNGNRVELEEIEHCLMSFPKINQAIVKLVKSQRSTSEDYLVAFVEAKQLLTPLVGKAGSFYQVTLGIRPDLIHAMKAVHLVTWPSYFAGSPIIAKYWSRVWTQFPDYQFCLLDESGEIAAVCNGIPLYWDETMEQFPKGWDEGIAKAFEQAAQKIKPNTILGLTGVVTEAFRSKGLSTLIVKAFRRLCGLHGMSYFFGPVRPVGMFETGHLDFASWVDCVDEQGEPKDHWLRTHKRLGATIVGAAPFSQLVEGTLSEWASWTGETWDKSGLYTRPDTLQPIEVNVEEDYARYYDPGIWVMHSGLDALEDKPCDYFNTIELKQYLSEHLPSYMIPLHFQIMAQLPVNDSGKVNESLLLSTVKWSQSSLLMPQTDSQKVVFDIWKEVLGVDALGIEDDFFMLGGQSLQLIHMLEKVYRQFSVRVSIKQFYKTPTIKTLCDEVLVC